VVFDPEGERIVTAPDLYTRHAISPYLGERLFGTVTATYLRAKAVFTLGKFGPGLEGGEIARTDLKNATADPSSLRSSG